MPKQITSKKVKYQGSADFINAQTGEIEKFEVTSIEEKDFNFTKVWMRNFIATLDLVGNRKTHLCYWIIDHINYENQLVYTLRRISDETGISLETIRVTMKILLDSDFLRRLQSGVYIVNPEIIYKGRHAARLNILNQYSNAPREEMSKEEKIKNLEQSIDVLTRQLRKLQATQDQNHIDCKVNEQLEFTEEMEIVQRAEEIKPSPSKRRKRKKGDKNESENSANSI